MAGHQIEGNNTNNNRYKEEFERTVDEKGIIKPSGMVWNHYNMVDEDIFLMNGSDHKEKGGRKQ